MLDYQQQGKWPAQLDPWQSPIKINSAAVQRVETTTQPFKVITPYHFESVEHHGNNLQFNGSGKVQLLGRLFEFKQLHFHFPAEHCLNDRIFPCEWHFVHQDMIGHLAVVAFGVVPGENTPALAPLYHSFALTEGQKKSFSLEIDLKKIVAEQTSGFYNYLGSLTTPPLTRGVEWWVAAEPLTAAQGQLAELARPFSTPNARACQPVMQRPIRLYTTENL
ncbi:carbonate dehydratase [Liquorilactobacillus ghanensis DSM 18630]|uniref:carbonic anhydrase n=1 Tax=Liquorilactobacillus ghanensis DSM 18630 TaxID=1423750 RepID=A0A0R1VJ59_9LACO|nr:carbonic anhydrase family protein [Liquorilactobacillus ghanensis]KRM05575.1 carbonate dehydratase [Liquorilactobacillus ghanensis DSM 18630]